MSWSIEYVSETEQIHVRSSGPIFNQDARAQTEEVVALLKRHDANFVLVDCSEVTLEVSLANLYWLPEYYLELGAPQHVRIALILPPRQFQLESYQFFQVACKNAGYNVRLFDSAEAAQTWLRQFRPDSRLPQV